MMRESLLQALRALRARRLRTLLTLLGIIIASGSLVLLVALLRGREAALQRANQEASESDLLELRGAEAPAEQRRRTTRALSRLDASSLADAPALADAWLGSEYSERGVAHIWIGVRT